MVKLFIHIPKNAGMTIRKSEVLRNKITPASTEKHKSRLYTQNVKTKMDLLGDHHGFEHARWRDLSPAAQKIPAFAVIRNPWDRVVSRYFFARKVIEKEMKVDPSYAATETFEAFIEERHKWGNEEYMWHRAVRGWYPAFDHVTDVDGNIKCDMIRFENLNEDLENYFKIDKMSRARNVTNMNKGSYMDLYTPETINIIGDWYKKDIDTWGYDFGSGPTRNCYFT